MNEQQIMTVKEFRSLTGKATAHFSDEQIAELIRQLDFIAGMYVKQVVPRKETAEKVKKS
jgi:hypothetical protein